MSTSPDVPAVPAKPLTAIQLAENQLVELKQQADTTLKQFHMIEGAIQGANIMLARLKVEEAKAVAFAKTEAAEAEAAAKLAVSKVESLADVAVTDTEREVSNVVEFVKKEL